MKNIRKLLASAFLMCLIIVCTGCGKESMAIEILGNEFVKGYTDVPFSSIDIGDNLEKISKVHGSPDKVWDSGQQMDFKVCRGTEY